MPRQKNGGTLNDALIIFSERNLASKIKDLEVSCTPNIGNYNCDAIGVSFKLHEISMCFINVNFSASAEDNMLKKNILNLLNFINLGHKDLQSLDQSCYTFIFGQFNPKIDKKLSSLMTQKKWKELYEQDELVLISRQVDILKEFQEYRIDYPPIDNGLYLSWNDRILFRSMINGIQQIDFNCSQIPYKQWKILPRLLYPKRALSSIFSVDIIASPEPFDKLNRIEIITSEITLKNPPENSHIYVAFYAPFLNKVSIPCTIIKKVSNSLVKWKKKEIPALIANIMNTQHITFIIIGVFIYNPDTKDNILGQTTVSLKQIFEKKNSLVLLNNFLKNGMKQNFELEMKIDIIS